MIIFPVVHACGTIAQNNIAISFEIGLRLSSAHFKSKRLKGECT